MPGRACGARGEMSKSASFEAPDGWFDGINNALAQHGE
jgi:hypothetical protein